MCHMTSLVGSLDVVYMYLHFTSFTELLIDSLFKSVGSW